MTVALAVRPTLVEIVIRASGSGYGCALERSEQTCELGSFVQGCDQFGIGGGKSSRESAVGCGKRCHRGAITGRKRGQVGDGVNSVLLIGVIEGIKSCSDRGYERLAPFLMYSVEEGFRTGPDIELRGL